MSRQRPDPAEVRPDLGPLFADPARLTRRDGPATSRVAGGEAVASGTAAADRAYLVELVTAHPGGTLAELGQIAARERGGDPYRWRLKLGRRTGEAIDAKEIHPKGSRDGMQQWWPGRDPDKVWP